MSIDAGFNYPDEEGICLTHGSEVRMSSSDGHHFHSLSSQWPGLGFSSVDAGLLGVGNKRGKFYLFSDDQYMRFDIRSNRFDQGYPKPIKGNWPIPFNRVNAAWNHPLGEDKYYLSSGSKYVRLSQNGSKLTLDRGFPLTIKDHWKGVSFARIDGAVQGRKSEKKENKMYFFSGEQYLRYDLKNRKVDNGYPRSIAPVWNLPASWKPVERKVKVRLLDVHCRTTEDSGPFGSHDELTVNWGGFFGKQSMKGQWRLAEIDDGDTKLFPSEKTTLFDGALAENSPVEVIVSLWDRDNGKESTNYTEIFNTTIDAAATAGGVTAAASAGAGGVLTGAAAVAKALGLAEAAGDFAGFFDPDDYLGEQTMEESTSSLPNGKKEHVLRFKRSAADYSVRIQTEVT